MHVHQGNPTCRVSSCSHSRVNDQGRNFPYFKKNCIWFHLSLALITSLVYFNPNYLLMGHNSTTTMSHQLLHNSNQIEVLKIKLNLLESNSQLVSLSPDGLQSRGI